MRVLVTGASGFIGRRLVPRLTREGHDVFCVRREGAARATAGTDVFWDLENATPPSDLPDRIDAVAHLAQARHYRDFPEDAPEMFRVNVAATAALLEYSRQARASVFCLISSGTVYEPYEGVIGEDAPVAPTRYLGASKLAAETLARPYADLFDVSILRLFFPYGPGQTERLVPDVIERVRNGRPVHLALDGEGLRLVPTFVDDIAAVIETALAVRWRGVFNVASPAVVSLRELAEVIGRALGKQPCFEVNDRKAGAIVPDLERLRCRFDLSSFTPLEEGIRRTVAAQTACES
jgi:UDP-glucose 4-epimerase